MTTPPLTEAELAAIEAERDRALIDFAIWQKFFQAKKVEFRGDGVVPGYREAREASLRYFAWQDSTIARHGALLADNRRLRAALHQMVEQCHPCGGKGRVPRAWPVTHWVSCASCDTARRALAGEEMA